MNREEALKRKEDIEFARYVELNSVLQWMETYMRDASEEQLESYIGINNELSRRINRIEDEWRKSE